MATHFHRGEQKIWCSRTQRKTWSVDGYAVNRHGEVKIWEFNGCNYHPGCPHCSHGQLSFTEIEKRHDIGQLGYKLEVMWECQFLKKLPELSRLETPLIPFILREKQNEKSLIEAVRANQIFGFLLCDIDCPSDVIDAMQDFPPIIRRETITDDHLTEYMKSKIKQENPGLKSFKRETLIQCFTARSYLLMTPLAHFYLKKGLVISNVQKFVQYIPRKVLLPFANHVTAMRIDAEKNNLATKGATAKGFGNSGYGKVNNLPFKVK